MYHILKVTLHVENEIMFPHIWTMQKYAQKQNRLLLINHILDVVQTEDLYLTIQYISYSMAETDQLVYRTILTKLRKNTGTVE